MTESMLEAVLPYGLPVKGWCFALNRKAKNNTELEGSLHISYHLFSFHGSIQDNKIHMVMEMVILA